MPATYTIKLRLKDLLEEKSMTQKQLSELTGIRPSTISKLTRNEGTGINYYHLKKICQVLKVNDISDIIDFNSA